METDCFRLTLAALEQRAIHAEHAIAKDLKEHHYLSAFINQMVAGEMRKLATEVEQAWKEERERDT